jgi:hypothetical protein
VCHQLGRRQRLPGRGLSLAERLRRRSRPCFGFRWGYATRAGSASQLLASNALGVSDWRDSLPVLEQHFPDWSFDSGWFD